MCFNLFIIMVFFGGPHQCKIPLVFIVLALTLYVAFRGMSRVPIFLLILFFKLARLFFICKCHPFLWFFLVLFLLLLGVGFQFNLAPFWGYLSFISCAFICFARTLKLSETMSTSFLLTPWLNCSKPDEWISINFFPSCYFVGVCIILKKVV
jgi:hypothetical protein